MFPANVPAPCSVMHRVSVVHGTGRGQASKTACQTLVMGVRTSTGRSQADTDKKRALIPDVTVLQLQSACSFVRSSVIRDTRAQDTITCNDSRVRVRVRSAAALSFVLVRVCVRNTRGDSSCSSTPPQSSAQPCVLSPNIRARGDSSKLTCPT